VTETAGVSLASSRVPGVAVGVGVGFGPGLVGRADLECGLAAGTAGP
jgi:hypothetical protein